MRKSNRFEVVSDKDGDNGFDVQKDYCSDPGSNLMPSGASTGVGMELVLRKSRWAKALPQKLNL